MNITVKPSTYLYIGILVLLIPLPWFFGWVSAVVFHEVCHYLAVRLLGGEVYRVSVHIGGVQMQCGMLTDKKRLIAILTGPIGGFLLVLLGRWFPRLALCSWVLSVYNLIPLLPLDGGRALEVIMGDKTFHCVQRMMLILVSMVAIGAACYMQLGILPVLIAIGLWLRNRNTTCKQTPFKVQ